MLVARNRAEGAAALKLDQGLLALTREGSRGLGHGSTAEEDSLGLSLARLEVDLEAVLAKGLVSKEKHTDLFKILGDGEVTKKVTVRVDAITKSAQAKIEAAGGSVEMKPQPTRRPKFVKKGQAAPADS